MARNFDGTNDLLTNTSASVLDTDHRVFFAWVKSDGGNAVICQLGNGGSFTHNPLKQQTNGKIRVSQSFSPTTGVWDSSTTIDDSTWHNAFTDYDRSSDANDPVIRIDAAADEASETTTPSGTANTGDDQINIGEGVSGSPDYQGDAYVFVVWSSSPTNNEILAMNNGVNPFVINNPNIIIFYPLNGNDSPEGDYIGQSTKLTVTGPTKATTNPPVELLENYL